MQHKQTKFREKNGDNDEKIRDTSGLVITTVLDTKITEVENKILNISILVTAAVLNKKNKWSWE